jgi:hypothetical protein
MKMKCITLLLIFLASGLIVRSQCWKPWLDKAENEMKSNNFSAALSHYQEAMKCGKGDPRLSDLQAKIDTCSKKLKIKNDLDSNMAKGYTAFNDSDYVSALTYFNKAKANEFSSTTDVDTWIGKCDFFSNYSNGKTEYNKGNFKSALEYFNKAKASKYIPENNDVTDWIDKCNKGTKNQGTSNYTAYNTLRSKGIEEYNKGNYSTALEKFNEAKEITSKPYNNDIQVWINKCNTSINNQGTSAFNSIRSKGIEEYNKGNYTTALEKFNEANESSSKPANNDIQSWIDKCNSSQGTSAYNDIKAKGVEEFNKKNYTTALEKFKEAKESTYKPADNDIQTWINKCEYYQLQEAGIKAYDQANYTLALESFNKALTAVYKSDTSGLADWIKKCNYQILFAQGETAFKSGSYTLAKESFKKAKDVGIAANSVVLDKWINLCDFFDLKTKGIEEYNKENFSTALEDFNKLKESSVKPDTTDIDSWITKCNYSIARADGISKYNNKNYFDALESFNKAKNSGYSAPNGDIGKWIENTMTYIEKIAWNRSFDFGKNADVICVVKTDEGYIVAGNSLSSGGNSEIFLQSTDLSGNKSWEKSISINEKIKANVIRPTKDKGYILAGSVYHSDKKNSDFYILKLNKKGNLEWEKFFARDGNEEAKDVQETDDSGFIITGSAITADSSNKDIYIIKANSKGEKEWDKTIGEEKKDFAVNCFQASDGGFIIGGNTESYKADKQDIVFFKTDAQGNIQWGNFSLVGGLKADEAEEILKTDDGGYIILGSTQSYGSYGNTIYLVKTDKECDLLWHFIYGDKTKDNLYCLTPTKDNGYLLVGYSLSAETGKKGIYIIKADSIGQKLWEKKYSKTVDYTIKSVIQADDDGFIITGNTSSTSTGSREIFLMKIDKSGNVIFN